MAQTAVDTLYEVATEVFETQAFAFVESCEKEDIENHHTTDYIVASIDFSGPSEGTLHLLISQNGGKELASNLLGVEPFSDDAIESAPDAVGEMLNVICGQFLTTHYGTSSVFNLSIPQCEHTDQHDAISYIDAPEIATLFIDEEPALVIADTKELVP